MKTESKINDAILILLSIMPTITLIVSSNTVIVNYILLIELAFILVLRIINFNGITKKSLLLVCINVITLFFTVYIYAPTGSAIIYICTILCFKVYNNISISNKTFLSIHLILGITLSLYLFNIKRPMYTGNSINDGFGNHINTNLVSILFFCAFLHISCVAVSVISSYKKRLLILAICAFIYGINVWFYEARSAMISMVIFSVIVLIKKKGFTYKNYKIICTTMFSVALVLPFVYVTLVNKIEIPLLWGKSLYTRMGVWGDCIKLIKEHFILGCGNNYRVSMRTGYGAATTVSMHNTMLSLWKILGLTPMLTFLFYCINHDSNKYDGNKNLYAQAAFISTIPVCFFESFYTEELLYMAFLPFLLVNISYKNDGERNE